MNSKGISIGRCIGFKAVVRECRAKDFPRRGSLGTFLAPFPSLFAVSGNSRGIFPLVRVSVVDSMLRSNDTRSCSRNRCIVDRSSFRNCSISLIRKIAKISRTRDAK